MGGRKKRAEADIARSGAPEIIGFLEYSDHSRTALSVPTERTDRYDVGLQSPADVPGLYITSHRPIYSFQQVQSIPATVETVEAVLSRYVGEYRNRYVQANSPSASIRIKEALISWAIFGYGNEIVASTHTAREAFDGFVIALKRTMPPSIGFKGLRIESPEVIVETKGGDFSFDAVSGGVAALIDLTWQVYLFALTRPAFVLVIDEPENHLHPELQRAVLPRLLNAFPFVQMIVATHNPLVVGSVEESQVYAFKYHRRRVASTPLDLRTKAASANEILRDVLGIETSVPDWAIQETQRLVRALATEDLTPGGAARLRQHLEAAGLNDLLPDAMEAWIKLRDQ